MHKPSSFLKPKSPNFSQKTVVTYPPVVMKPISKKKERGSGGSPMLLSIFIVSVFILVISEAAGKTEERYSKAKYALEKIVAGEKIERS